jgi:hypothetical protein
MNWLLQIDTEIKRIQPNDNPGRTRTIARRIAGIALKELYKSNDIDFLKILVRATDDHSLTEPIKNACLRLAARLSSDFTSPSIDPIGDAKMIVEFVKKQLHQFPT